MHTDPGNVFVGRVSELDQLRRGLVDARAGRGRLFMLTGEAGIGKTRLADELAGGASGDDVRILWGRCWESGGAPAYWPWVQALRSYVSDVDTEVLRQQLGRGAGELAQIVPEIRARLSPVESSAPNASEQARFQLFDSLTAFLRAAAAERPIVLILEDLHAADQPSLLLLQFVARELRSLPMLIIGTARPIDRGGDRIVADILAAITREGRRILLPALTREDVAQYLSNATAAATAETVDAVYSATEGNPLFVTEVLHLLKDDGRETDAGMSPELHLPVVLRTAIRQRLAALSDTTRAVLDVAAVIGREFEVSVLERVWTRPNDETRQRHLVFDALETAEAAGVVRRVPGSISGYLFAHALIRDTLHDDLPRASRMSVHREVAEALETVWAANPAQHLAEIAYHYVAAAPDGDVDKALEYTRRAGDRALALLAYEEAVQHYERAREVLALRPGPPRAADEVIRCDLLLALGDAVWGAGDLAKMREYAQLAAESARTLRNVVDPKEAAVRTARAALAFGGRQFRAHGIYEEQVVRLLEEARAAFGDEDDPLRARVLARLAYVIYLQPNSLERRDALSREAVAMARRCGDPLTLSMVLNDRRWTVWHPDTIDERRQIADELVTLAERAGNRDMTLAEHAWRMIDFLELGQIALVDTAFSTYARIAKEFPGPSYDWQIVRFTAMRHTLEGRFEEGERAAMLLLESPRRSPQQDTLLDHTAQLIDIRIHQGRLDEALTSSRSLVNQFPWAIVFHYIIPFIHAELGQTTEARLEIERVDPSGQAELRREWIRLPIAAFLAETCALVGDVERSRALYPQLLPYADRCVVIAYGVACYGSVARYLGLLAATIGDHDAAAKHYEAALLVNSRLRARPFVARTQLDYGRWLQQHGEHTKADELLSAALATAVELGMQRLAERISEIYRPDGKPAAAAGRAEAPVAARFQQTGEFWSIRFGDATFQLKSILGLTYIAHLLHHPGVDFHVTDLVDLAEGGRAGNTSAPREAITARSLGDAGDILDAQAKSEYRRRLADLREELDEAGEMNDLGRVDRARAEMDALTEQLAQGIGFGGRHRRAASHVERARVSVTKRIAIALKKVNEHDPMLAGYLRSRIKTGTLCTYEPDPIRPVTWEL